MKKNLYSKFALIGGAYLYLGLVALVADEKAASPLLILPEGETDTVAEKTAEGAFILPDDIEAETEASAEDDEIFQVLPSFVVSTEKDEGYYSAHSLSGTRTSALIKDTPMTIDVVNQELLDDLDLREINDISEVLAGVDIDTTSEFNNRSITMRGLRTTSQFFEFMPRRLNANGYNRGRVEVIRGSNSLVYGQAAPGGKLNLLAKRAEFNKDSKTITASAGSYNNYQGKIDINEVINDKIAVRFMGVHSESDSYHEDRRTEFDGLTLEATYRPTEKTEVRLHLETVEQSRRGSSSLYSDDTSRFGDTGTLDGSPLTSEFVNYLPNAVIKDIINHRVGVQDNSGTRDSIPDFFTSKQDIKDFYDAIEPDWDQQGIFAGPNSYTDVDGHYILGDVTHHFMDNLVLKVAAAQDHGHREKFTRSGTSNVRLSAGSNPSNIRYYESGGTELDPDVETILSGASLSTRLARDEQDDDTNSLRATLAWQTEFGSSSQQFIFGFDFDRHTIEQETFSRYSEDPYPLSTDPNYGGNGVIDNDADRISTLFLLNRSDMLSLYLDDSEGVFLTTATKDIQIDTTAGWIANSGSYFNGRLNTLAGVRFDLIETESKRDAFTWNDVRDPNFTDPKGFGTGERKEGEYSQWSPTLGVLYWLNSNIAFFANYSRSIESPSGFELNVFGDLVPPQYGEGTEVGFKFEAFEGKLNGAVMAFQIEKENHASSLDNDELEVIYPQSEYPDLYFDDGSRNYKGRDEPGAVVEVQGIEATIYYNPTREWSFIFGYAFLDTEKSAIPEGATEGLGEKLEGTTPHSATLTASYKFKDGFLDGVSIGTNFKYKSSSLYDTVSTSEGRKEIWLSDNLEQSVFVGYSTKLGKSKRAPKLKLRFQVKNLWDSKDLVAGSNLRGNAKANFTKPRSYNFSASVSF